jgi:hypothetical protein
MKGKDMQINKDSKLILLFKIINHCEEKEQCSDVFDGQMYFLNDK